MFNINPLPAIKCSVQPECSYILALVVRSPTWVDHGLLQVKMKAAGHPFPKPKQGISTAKIAKQVQSLTVISNHD